MENIGSKALRAVLVVLGLVNILIGINIGFGGILTLGLQGQISFFQVVNEHAFLVQDSHIRFLGGLYGGTGLFLMLASTNLSKYQTALNLVFALIFIGGLSRLTMLRMDIVFGREIVGSLIVELGLMPILYIWLAKTVRGQIRQIFAKLQLA